MAVAISALEVVIIHKRGTLMPMNINSSKLIAQHSGYYTFYREVQNDSTNGNAVWRKVFFCPNGSTSLSAKAKRILEREKADSMDSQELAYASDRQTDIGSFPRKLGQRFDRLCKKFSVELICYCVQNNVYYFVLILPTVKTTKLTDEEILDLFMG